MVAIPVASGTVIKQTALRSLEVFSSHGGLGIVGVVVWVTDKSNDTVCRVVASRTFGFWHRGFDVDASWHNKEILAEWVASTQETAIA